MHRSFEDLERLWQAEPLLPRGRGTVELICVRSSDGVHLCAPEVSVTEERGVEGDRWYDKADRDKEAQVTLMATRVAELVTSSHAPLHAAGDNFLVNFDLADDALPPGTRLRLGSALLEVSSKPHAGCKKFRDRFGLEALRWVNFRAHRARRLRGVNCRVIKGGTVAVGDVIEIVAPPEGERQ
jgi:MOSC domain-containing protein YiiM